MYSKIIILLFSLYLNEVLSSDSCNKQIKCHECIRDASACDWCGSNDYTGIRCKSVSTEQGWCPDSLEKPKNFKNATIKRDFSSVSGTVTQIKPQRYHLELRPGQPLVFPFSFKGAQDYPVDLYFLFDASVTMTNLRKQAADQSENIYKTMKNMTNDVFLGMGTFVDKNTLPYTLNVTANLAYSFKHRLNLTKEYKMFKNATDAIPKGDNRDLPEGTLDALAQVMACKNIGWRDESRKIVVVITDGPYHAAGDGRSGGIFQPYDGECYTDNGEYTKELEMDYPSVSMINKLARKNEIIVIFAVTYDVDHVYKSLSSAIAGSQIVTLDDEQKDGIVTTLKDIYEKITANIKLSWSIRSGGRKNFKISFDPDCSLPIPECVVSNGKEHNFTGTIELLEYDGNDRADVDITIEGINEKLTLDIEVIKDCKICESKVENNSSYCYGEKRECGICKCSDQKIGERCNCVRNAVNNNVTGLTCIGENMTKSCNERGFCECGTCSCSEGFGGRYCECNLQNCPRNDKGSVCSSEGHGECQCDGSCKCAPDWSGPACECFKSEEQCTKDDMIIVCNNRGTCNCGNCTCNAIESWDSRKDQDKYCVVSPCPQCHNLQCKILQDCVLCNIKNNTDCPCSFFDYEIFDELPVDVLNSSDWNICADVRVDVGCYTKFTYKYDDDRYRIQLKLHRKKDCAEMQYIFGGIFLLSLLLLGIFTLVAWKLLTEARDRQEYLRFVKDHQDDINKPCDNPLYEPASVLYKNPAFRKRSVNY